VRGFAWRGPELWRARLDAPVTDAELHVARRVQRQHPRLADLEPAVVARLDLTADAA
jgi:hypothetical protein